MSHFTILQLGQVIPALDALISTMKKGEVAKMTTTPKYAFGRLGCPPRIPANCSLQFEVELIYFERKKVVMKST
jgi:FKBP-type peptidyl-prolyl cis-trans isomerase